MNDSGIAPEEFFFPPGLSFGKIVSGDEVKLFRRIAERLKLTLKSRGSQLVFSGGAPGRGRAFFEALMRMYDLKKQPLDEFDFDLLLRNYADDAPLGLEALWNARLRVSPKRREVLARSPRQLEYLRAMRGKEVVFGIGPAGTGKTYLAMAMAVSMFLSGEVRRIVLTRPARESGEKLGFLPGSLEEKVSPYLRPLYDALYDMLTPEEAEDLTRRGIIEVAPLAFMRGRTLNNAFIILDEAQNTTTDQMLMFLTRMGFGSRCVITGDPQQSDLTERESSGLLRALDTLSKVPELGFVRFTTRDVVRHPLLEKIITAYTGKN